MTRNVGDQRGSILVPVMLIGLTSTLILGALVNHSVYLEQAAVENRLAETRAYWLTIGHFRYALSRERLYGLCPQSGGCGGFGVGGNTIKDTDKVTVLQSYLDEISGLRTFTYPDENSGYTIKINVAGAVDDDPLRQNFSGYLMMTSLLPGGRCQHAPCPFGFGAAVHALPAAVLHQPYLRLCAVRADHQQQ